MTGRYVSLSQAEQVSHEKEFGGYNHLPPNFKEITPEEFAQCDFFVYRIDMIESRQPYGPNDKRAAQLKVDAGTSLRLFYMNNTTGFAIGHDYWAKRLRFFRFQLCEHTFKGVPEESRMCYHVSVCTKCGYRQAIDSSD